MKTQNKETIRLLVEEVFNQGNLSVLSEVIHSEYVYESPTERMEGVEELRAFIQALRIAFPDLHLRIEDQIAEGEKVTTKVTMSGTHRGDLLGLPETGRSIYLQGVIISRLEVGLIREEWELLDQLTLLQQLGIAEPICE